MSFWDGDGPPRTKVQRGANAIRYAIGALDDARVDTPYEVWKTLKPHALRAKVALEAIDAGLKELDASWCEKCDGRWTDDPVHKAHCEVKPDPDEHKNISDALITDVVYGGAPLATRED